MLMNLSRGSQGCLRRGLLVWLLMAGGAFGARGAATPDPLLELLIQKGMLTRAEADRVKAEAEANRTNQASMPAVDSKWKIAKSIKNVELFGDVRLRYEHREAATPVGARLELDRARVAARIGLRGEVFDDFYYGFRLDTSSNPRSPWVTFGGSSPSPFGKSADSIYLGQAYLGWRPTDWVDLTAGKMPNPLYTTSMVWDPDLNPEGVAERFKYRAGAAEFFANFGQFVYQDNSPSFVSGSLLPAVVSSSRTEQQTDSTFLLAYQAGVKYQFTPEISAKLAPAFYQYMGLTTSRSVAASVSPNGIGDAFIGEGSYGGAGSPAPVNGLTTQNGILYNQVGVRNLLVLEVPFEVNFKICDLNARIFGDYSYNLEGADRADAAVRALGATVAGTSAAPPLLRYGPQRDDVHAYQAGFALGSQDSLGMVYGSVARRHAWEFRTYWQHLEQYALDPNLIDSDFLEGRGNLEGFYAAFSYGFSENVIGTFRYGYAQRINDKLGTGGSNLDIPQLNPIDHYNLLQLDLTLRL